MEEIQTRRISDEELAKKREAYNLVLDEIRSGEAIKKAAEAKTREQGGAVVRIAAQGE